MASKTQKTQESFPKSAGTFIAMKHLFILSAPRISICLDLMNGCGISNTSITLTVLTASIQMYLCQTRQPHPEFESIEDINNYLLQHKEVIDRIKATDGDAKFVFLMFDEKTEKLVKEIGGEVWFPKAALRNRVDNKIETVRIGNKAGVPSVPNILAEIRQLRRPHRSGQQGRSRQGPGTAVRLW